MIWRYKKQLYITYREKHTSIINLREKRRNTLITYKKEEEGERERVWII